MPLPVLHTIVGRAFAGFALIITAMALKSLIQKQPLDGNFFGAVVIGEGLAVVQMLLGFIMMGSGGVPARGIHYLYGALTVMMWPATFGYTRGQDRKGETLYWLGISAFLFGLSLRAFSTGG